MTVGLKNKAALLLLLLVAACLAGCSSVMRPPPAAAYMDSYAKDGAVGSFGLSYYAGDLENGRHENNSYSHYSYAEWWGDVNLASYISGGYFTFGLGYQTFSPFMQMGFVSPYLGFTAWSNMNAIVIPAIKSDERGALWRYSGGGMAIEQIPLNDNWKIGFTEHVSRNGREVYFVDEDCYSFDCGIPVPRHRFYTEVGGGFYVSKKIGSDSKVSLEFRYGRDLDEDRNRFALTLDIWTSTTATLGGNDVMRSMAKKNAKKMREIDAVYADSLRDENGKIDSLHTIKRQWFRIPDSSKTMSLAEHPSDSVTAVTSKGICYDEGSRSVWLKQDYGNTAYRVPVDSFDYCQQMEHKVLFWPSLLVGTLSFLPGALATNSGVGGLMIGLGVSVAYWAVSNFALDPEDLVPKVYPELCSEKHSRENVLAWLKQYPCRSEMQSQEAGK